ncbi:MAG TPA: HTH domain-containing protein [Trueperaceae bacterium]|nr:HTH domain-containing protein [Trueperaceae bacterium]
MPTKSKIDGLSETQRKVASLLARQRGATVSDLAEACSMSERAIRNLIDRLRGKGLRIENVQRGSGRFHLARSAASGRTRRRGRRAVREASAEA